MTSDLCVHLSRNFKTSPEKLFNAWSDPEFITRWWKNLTVAKLEFVEGGRYRFEWESWDGHVEGEYRTLRPFKEIEFSWVGVSKSGERENPSLVKIAFEEIAAGQTIMTLAHSLNASVDLYSSHREGWCRAADDLAGEFVRTQSAVTVERIIDAEPAAVFEWLTSPAQMNRWFFSDCTTNPSLEGDYRIKWESVDDPARNHERHGRYLRFEQDRLITFEWKGFSDTKLSGHVTEVTVELTPIDGKTRLVLSHGGWGDDAAWIAARDQHESGWNFYVDNLARVIGNARGLPVMPLPEQPDLRTMAFGQRV